VAYRFGPDDVSHLRSAAGRAQLAEAAGRLRLSADDRIADAAEARAIAGAHGPAVLETLRLRRRARPKLAEAEGWLLTDAALQQATPSRVANHRAQRLEGRDVHDVTCSIGADLVAAARVAGGVIGSDLDPIRLAMAQANCASAGVAPLLCRADALAPVSRHSVVLADPARRSASGRRWVAPSDLVPRLDALAEVYRHRDLAVKCAPSLDFDAVPWASEIEVTSLDGQVREACLWTGALASPCARRRATVLSGAAATVTVTGSEPDDCGTGPVGKWLVDPDGAIVRAGLVRQYGLRHGLHQIDEHIAYLTGDEPPPGVRALRVLDEFRYTEKALRAELVRRRVGRLEILTRGLGIAPDALRRRLKLRGENGMTVVLARVGSLRTAILCEPRA
jgi:hypothetical protein